MTLRLLKVIVQPRVAPLAISAEDWQANRVPPLAVEDFVVQPVFVLDDGTNLKELQAEAVVVSPAEWPTYAIERFAVDFDTLRQQFEFQTEVDAELESGG